MAALVYVEHNNTDIKDATLSTITAAKGFGDVHAVVIGNNCANVADTVATIDGISKVLLINAPTYEHPLAEELVAAIMSVANGYDAILASATTTGKNFMPRVAANLDVAQISDITDIISEDTFKRPIYAGNAIATVKSSDAVKVITVRATSFDKARVGSSVAPIEAVSASEKVGISSFVSAELSVSDRPELTSASIIISGGRGMGSAENFAIIDGVADKLGAAVGASRAAVDSGFVPNDYQIGQTGKIVAPELYIAVGISGAIQHLAGMKDSKTIVAINKDEDAPIFQVADYGLVADLFEAIPALEKALG